MSASDPKRTLRINKLAFVLNQESECEGVSKISIYRIDAVQERLRLCLFPTSLNQETHNRLVVECLMWITAPHRTEEKRLTLLPLFKC